MTVPPGPDAAFLILPAPLADRVRGQAAARPNHEICGALLGLGDEVVDLRPVENVSPRPDRAFEVSPVALIAVEKEARERDLEVIGWYHSHPVRRDGVPRPAIPSRTDRALAWWGHVHLIESAGTLRAWRMPDSGSDFTELEIRQERAD